MPKSLEEAAEDYEAARYAENQEVARKLRAARSELETQRTRAVEALGEADEARRELALYEADYSERPEWAKPPSEAEGSNRGTLVAFLSDTHYGEIVRADEMDDYNAYNLKIAEARTARFFERVIRIARSYFAGVEYDGIVLALGGDLVSGDIHDELTETNEATTYETVLWAVPKLAAGVEMLAEEFGQVHVVSAPGNHGRTTRKPHAKKASANNADTLIAHLVARQLEGREGVTFNIPATADVRFEVYRWRFSMEHGEVFQKGFAGSAEIGSLGPVKRGTMRKLTQATAEGKSFDYNLVGHFHQYVPAASQAFVMNGSLKGYDEFARRHHFKPEPAQQALMVCTPERGITTQAPVFVAGDHKSEGW